MAFSFTCDPNVKTVIMIGLIALAAPLSWIHSLNELNHLSPCDDDTPCIYHKEFFDGVLPSPTAADFGIINGVDPVETSGYNLSDPAKLLRTYHVYPSCPEHNMTQECSMSFGKNVNNTLKRSPSAYMFQAAIMCWGTSRITHDVMLLCDCNSDRILIISFASALALGLCVISAFYWAAGALELFYAPLELTCGCYYSIKHFSAIVVLSAPFAFLFHFVTTCEGWFRALLEGPYLHTIAYRLPLRCVQDGTKPTGTFRGTAVLSHAVSKPRPFQRATRSLVVVAAVALPLVWVVIMQVLFAVAQVLFIRLVQIGCEKVNMAVTPNLLKMFLLPHVLGGILLEMLALSFLMSITPRCSTLARMPVSCRLGLFLSLNVFLMGLWMWLKIHTEGNVAVLVRRCIVMVFLGLLTWTLEALGSLRKGVCAVDLEEHFLRLPSSVGLTKMLLLRALVLKAYGLEKWNNDECFIKDARAAFPDLADLLDDDPKEPAVEEGQAEEAPLSSRSLLFDEISSSSSSSSSSC